MIGFIPKKKPTNFQLIKEVYDEAIWREKVKRELKCKDHWYKIYRQNIKVSNVKVKVKLTLVRHSLTLS